MIITAERTGQVPLRFDGVCLGSGTAEVGKRRYHVSLFRTVADEYVLTSVFSSDWERERSHHIAIVATTVDELQAQLSTINPIPAQVGYPLGDQYVAKQERLEADLAAAFGAAVSDAMRGGGVAQEI